MPQGRRTVVHLLNYCPERRTKTIDIVETSCRSTTCGLAPLEKRPSTFISRRAGKR